MTQSPPVSRGNPEPSPAATEALAKVLAELRELAPAETDSPPSFPPRLTRADRPTLRSRKIELEFEGERPPERRPFKAIAATAVFLIVGAGAMNVAYPSVKGLFSTTSSALAEKRELSTASPDLGPSERRTALAPMATRADAAPQRSEAALPGNAVASAGPPPTVRVLPEPVEAGSISTTGATPTVVASASPRLLGPALQLPLPSPAPFMAIESETPGARAAPEETPQPIAPVQAVMPEQQEVTAAVAVASAAPPPLEAAQAPLEAAPLPREVAATVPAPAPVVKLAPPAPAPEVKPVPPPPATPAANVDRLIRRAGELIEEGDISAARLLLERALTGGSAQAAFALAQTYDPQVLAQWQARGIKGDPARARQLYQIASEKGIAGANESIASLR